MEEAGTKILEQANGTDEVSSEDIVDAAGSVLNGGANIIRSAAVSQNNEEVRRKGEQMSTTRKSPTMLSKYVFFS